jgi:hypothetical protein
VRRGHDTRAKVLALLREDDLTNRQICDKLGLCFDSVRRHTNAEHDAGRIHICDWHEMIGSAGPAAAIYRFGPGKDKPYPKATVAKRCARYREKHAGTLRAKRLAKTKPVNPFSRLFLG